MIGFTGSIGTDADDVVYESQPLNGDYDQVTFQATTGGVTVQGMIAGQWSGDLAVQPLETTTPNTYVTSSSGTALFRLHGKFEKIRFLQLDATAANVRGVIA